MLPVVSSDIENLAYYYGSDSRRRATGGAAPVDYSRSYCNSDYKAAAAAGTVASQVRNLLQDIK